MKKILISFLSVLYIMPAMAAKSDGNKWASAWGVSGALTCEGTTGNSGDADTQYGYYPALIARTIVEHGGYFCETFIRSKRNGNYGQPYTIYYDIPNPTCLWLCEDGFYGKDCASTTPTKCGEFITKDTKFRITTKTDNSVPGASFACGTHRSEGQYCDVDSDEGGGSIEDTIQMLVNDVYTRCAGVDSYDKNKAKCYQAQEHDVLLAVNEIKIAEDGSTNLENTLNYSFYVRPLNVRAGMISLNSWGWPVVQWVGNPAKILCADGWRLNSEGTACELVPPEFSEICNLEKLCASTPRDKYKEGVHAVIAAPKDASQEDENVKKITASGCSTKATVFRCAVSSQGFKAKNDFECIDCPNPRQGVRYNGVCESCETGYIFDTEQNLCVPAEGLDWTAMRVGVGKADSNELKDQCWVKEEPTKYKQCMLGMDTNADTN